MCLVSLTAHDDHRFLLPCPSFSLPRPFLFLPLHSPILSSLAPVFHPSFSSIPAFPVHLHIFFYLISLVMIHLFIFLVYLEPFPFKLQPVYAYFSMSYYFFLLQSLLFPLPPVTHTHLHPFLILLFLLSLLFFSSHLLTFPAHFFLLQSLPFS